VRPRTKRAYNHVTRRGRITAHERGNGGPRAARILLFWRPVPVEPGPTRDVHACIWKRVPDQNRMAARVGSWRTMNRANISGFGTKSSLKSRGLRIDYKDARRIIDLDDLGMILARITADTMDAHRMRIMNLQVEQT